MTRPSVGECEEGLIKIDRPVDGGLSAANDEHRLQSI
jgi:hypothetical protein